MLFQECPIYNPQNFNFSENSRSDHPRESVIKQNFTLENTFNVFSS